MADTSLIENRLGLLIWKTSNFWQTRIRRILSPYQITLNEYLVLQSIFQLLEVNSSIYQNKITKYAGIDIAVVSVTLKSLEKKKYILRSFKKDNRKKIIKILRLGNDLFIKIHPLVLEEENKIFKNLNNEIFNFTNSLKLLLGRKIRIKAELEN